jgi:hypothetical protein
MPYFVYSDWSTVQNYSLMNVSVEHGRRISWAVRELMEEEKKQQDTITFLHGTQFCKETVSREWPIMQ